MTIAIKHVLDGGRALRRQAAVLTSEGTQRSQNAVTRIKTAGETARTALESLDRLRDQAFFGLTPMRDKLYPLAGLANSGSPAEEEANYLRPPVIDLESQPIAPNAMLNIGAGAAIGAGFGALVAYGAYMVSSAVAAPSMLIGVLLTIIGALIAGMANGRQAIRIAHIQQDFAAKCSSDADAFVRETERIVKAVEMTTIVIERMRCNMLTQQAQLETVATDTTNAAVLLKDVLNTPLMNAEGAFIQEVIDKLHEQKERVTQFSARLAALEA